MKTVTAKPFVKWAGGKQALAKLIVAEFPTFDRYVEPFLGGGSVFLSSGAPQALLNDSNSWLVATFEAVRDDWRRVAKILDTLPNTKEDFLRIREESRSTQRGRWRRAAYFIYLNKTCFRGLYRVNRQNHFNVPYGAYDRSYYSPDNLEAVSHALQGVVMRCCDFEIALEGITSSDFTYLDPPYYKLGGYSDFNRYTPDQFREAEHVRLAALCRELDGRGVRWLLSNSNTPFIHGLYQGFRIREIEARRDINLESRKRGVTELLIANYDL